MQYAHRVTSKIDILFYNVMTAQYISHKTLEMTPLSRSL